MPTRAHVNDTRMTLLYMYAIDCIYLPRGHAGEQNRGVLCGKIFAYARGAVSHPYFNYSAFFSFRPYKPLALALKIEPRARFGPNLKVFGL